MFKVAAIKSKDTLEVLFVGMSVCYVNLTNNSFLIMSQTLNEGKCLPYTPKDKCYTIKGLVI